MAKLQMPQMHPPFPFQLPSPCHLFPVQKLFRVRRFSWSTYFQNFSWKFGEEPFGYTCRLSTIPPIIFLKVPIYPYQVHEVLAPYYRYKYTCSFVHPHLSEAIWRHHLAGNLDITPHHNTYTSNLTTEIAEHHTKPEKWFNVGVVRMWLPRIREIITTVARPSQQRQVSLF